MPGPGHTFHSFVLDWGSRFQVRLGSAGCLLTEDEAITWALNWIWQIFKAERILFVEMFQGELRLEQRHWLYNDPHKGWERIETWGEVLEHYPGRGKGWLLLEIKKALLTLAPKR